MLFSPLPHRIMREVEKLSQLTLPLECYTDEALAIDYLARCLFEGTLALVIGAGASKYMGLPSWPELVGRCIAYANVPSEDKISDEIDGTELMKLMDPVENKLSPEEYITAVHKSLYEDVKYENDIIKKDLLISFGALIMGSKRGSVSQIITFNFDDVLEWYLKLHGYYSQVIYKLPMLTKASDVTIYHINGYLPRDLRNHSDFIILSKLKSDERMGARHDAWKSLLEELLLSKVVMFIGLSGKDPIFDPILASVARQISNGRPTGFWVFGLDPDRQSKDVGEKAKEETRKKEKDHLMLRNVVPLYLANKDEIPKFILKICQKASMLMP